MVDRIIEAINADQINPNNISFEQIRKVGRRNHGDDTYRELEHGKGVLSSVEHLDQYLYSYAPMTKQQWDYFLSSAFIPPSGDIHLVDYGCGQGLACALLLDRLGPELVDRLHKITLIDKSAVALKRALAVIQCYGKSPEVIGINKCLHDLTLEDLRLDETVHNIHLFSNVLDIPYSFQSSTLMEKILKNRGKHTIFAVSFASGVKRIPFVRSSVHKLREKNQEHLSIDTDRMQNFNFSGKPGAKEEAILWELHLEVLNGAI